MRLDGWPTVVDLAWVQPRMSAVLEDISCDLACNLQPMHKQNNPHAKYPLTDIKFKKQLNSRDVITRKFIYSINDRNL